MNVMIDHASYESIHTYLLSHGQQELAGHLDRIWQELIKRTPEEADDEIESVKLNEGETPDYNNGKGRGDGLS